MPGWGTGIGADMTLGQKQEKFSNMIMLLLIHIHALGYQVRGGHWYRCENCYTGAKNSAHKLKLAFDVNLFKNGEYLTSGKEHEIIHDYWDSIGGAPRIPNDLNHYSLSHNGIR